MRNLEPRLSDYRLPVEEQVEVDDARPAPWNAAAITSEAVLDRQQRLEELPRSEAGLDLDRAVQEPRLIGHPHGLGLTEPGDAADFRSGKRAERGDRPSKP